MVEVEGRSKTFPIIVGLLLIVLVAGGIAWVVNEKQKRAAAAEAAADKGPVVDDPDKLEAEIREIQRTIPRAFRIVERHENYISIRIDKDFYLMPESEKRRFYNKIMAAIRTDSPSFNVLLQDYYTGDIRVTLEAARFHEH